MYDSRPSYISTIRQHNGAIAGYAVDIAYHTAQAEPDTNIIDELKALYETEKQRLEDAWKKVKAKGEDFFNQVWDYVKGIFEQLAGDLIAFLLKHNILIF